MDPQHISLFGSGDRKNLNTMSISELISVLRDTFMKRDFNRVEETLVSREAMLKAEIEEKSLVIGLLQERIQFERLEKIRVESELKKKVRGEKVVESEIGGGRSKVDNVAVVKVEAEKVGVFMGGVKRLNGGESSKEDCLATSGCWWTTNLKQQNQTETSSSILTNLMDENQTITTVPKVVESSKDADNNNKAIVAVDSDCPKNISQSFGQRTSIYRGVNRHKWTGRYEAHLWDNSCRREGQVRKGRLVYLGGYDKEEKAARAYDLAALKYWRPTATTNFPVSDYTKELEEMKDAGKQEFIASLRRKSSGFSRGASIYRGVTRHHQQGRWQARIGRVAGKGYLHLGRFEEEAAEAYDIAAIKFRGANAITNFEMSRYDMGAILKSSLPVGGTTKRMKLSQESEKNAAAITVNQQPDYTNMNNNSSISFSNIHPVTQLCF